MRKPATITLDIEAFDYLSLGALATYVYLLAKPDASPNEIAKATHRSLATVYRSFKPLKDAGLMASRRVYCIQTSDLEQAA